MIHRMKYAAAIAATAFLLPVPLAGVASAAMFPSHTESARCVLQMSNTQQCFSASRMSAAVRLMRVHPMDPTALVRQYARLSLFQIIVGGTGVVASIAPRSAPQITYVYGSMPLSAAGIPNPLLANPKYVVVTEAITAHPTTSMTMKRDLGVHCSCSPGTSTANGPWELAGSLPQQGMSLKLMSNESRSVVHGIGATMVRRSISASKH